MESERFVPFILQTERIAKNIKRLADAKMEPYGLRSAHVMCILQLAKSEKGLSSAELSEACGVDKAFISRITTELTEKGYISGYQSQYGLTVETVDGETLDWEESGAYWSLYINGEYAMTGVSSTKVEDGATYTFKAEKM